MKASIARAVATMTVWALLSTGCGSSNSPESDFAMSARVNGTSWSPTQSTGTPPAYANFYEGDNTLSVQGISNQGSGSSSRVESVSFLLRDVAGPGAYALGDELTSSYGWYLRIDGLLGDPSYVSALYRTTDAVTGTVVLTAFDPDTHTLQGTFDFRARNAQTGATVTLTAGAFDGSYQTLPGHS